MQTYSWISRWEGLYGTNSKTYWNWDCDWDCDCFFNTSASCFASPSHLVSSSVTTWSTSDTLWGCDGDGDGDGDGDEEEGDGVALARLFTRVVVATGSNGHTGAELEPKLEASIKQGCLNTSGSSSSSFHLR